MINTTDEPEVNEEARPPPVVLEFEIPGSRTPHNEPHNQTTALNAETDLQEPRNAEMLHVPEMKAELAQGAECDHPINQPAVTGPRRGRLKLSYLMDYVLA